MTNSGNHVYVMNTTDVRYIAAYIQNSSADALQFTMQSRSMANVQLDIGHSEVITIDQLDATMLEQGVARAPLPAEFPSDSWAHAPPASSVTNVVLPNQDNHTAAIVVSTQDRDVQTTWGAALHPPLQQLPATADSVTLVASRRRRPVGWLVHPPQPQFRISTASTTATVRVACHGGCLVFNIRRTPYQLPDSAPHEDSTLLDTVEGISWEEAY